MQQQRPQRCRNDTTTTPVHSLYQRVPLLKFVCVVFVCMSPCAAHLQCHRAPLPLFGVVTACSSPTILPSNLRIWGSHLLKVGSHGGRGGYGAKRSLRTEHGPLTFGSIQSFIFPQRKIFSGSYVGGSKERQPPPPPLLVSK